MNRKTPQCSRAHWTILSILIPLQGWIFSWSRYLGLSKPKRNLEGSRPTASVHAFLLYQAVFFMLLFHSQNSIKSQCVVLYLLPFYRSENKRFKKKVLLNGSHVLVKYLLLALAALGSVVLEAQTLLVPMSLVSGWTLIKVIIGVSSLSQAPSLGHFGCGYFLSPWRQPWPNHLKHFLITTKHLILPK